MPCRRAITAWRRRRLSRRMRSRHCTCGNLQKRRGPNGLAIESDVSTAFPNPGFRSGRRAELAAWGRTYRYHDSLFSSQIVSRNEELLARPIELVAQPRRQDNPDRELSFRVDEGNAGTGGVQQPQGKLNAAAVECEGWIEFDGFIWSTLKILPQPGAKLDRLCLQLPLRKEIATLQQSRMANLKARGGKVAPWSDTLSSLSQVWLGNETVGLQWFAGDNYSWQCMASKRMLQLDVGDREVVLTANLIDHAVILDDLPASTPLD